MSSFREDGAATLDWVASYLERVPELPVLSQVEPGAIRAALPASPPEEPEPFSAILDDLDTVLMSGLTHSQSPRWFAYFAITGSEPGILAELLIAGLNQLGILWRTSPALQELEEVTLDWLAQLLGLPAGLHGHLEDTASTSTLVSLAVARSLRPSDRAVVISEQAHSSVDKAAKLLELEVRKVPVDDDFRMRPELLDLDGACAVVATIGTTASTAVDPVSGSRTRVPSATSGSTSTLRTPGRRRSARSSGITSKGGSAPTRSSSIRTSGSARRSTARCSGRGGRTSTATHSASCPSTSASTRTSSA